MKDFLFIINPIAGKKGNLGLDVKIRSLFTGADKTYDCIYTQSSGDAQQIVKREFNNYKLFVAVGGDGTVKEVAEGVSAIGGDRFGIIPAGSGNDLARLFGLSKDLPSAIRALFSESYEEIDRISCSDGSLVLNIASMGIDAETNREADKYKKNIGGTFAYLFALFRTLFKFRKKRVILNLDGSEEEVSPLMICFGNGKFYGGGIPIIPWSDHNDGYISGFMIENMNKFKLIFSLAVALFGDLRKIKGVRQINVKSITIKPVDNNCVFNCDGEVKNFKEGVTISVNNSPLLVKVP